MGFFGRLDAALQKDLISFVDAENKKEKTTLGDNIVAGILEKIIGGDCRVSGIATDHEKKKMFVEFSFYEEDV